MLFIKNYKRTFEFGKIIIWNIVRFYISDTLTKNWS